MAMVSSLFAVLPLVAVDALPQDLRTQAVAPSDPTLFLLALALLAGAVIIVLTRTKAGPIAKNTLFETIRQPVVLLLVAVSVVLTIFSGLMPMYTLSYQDTKMVKDMGFSTATLCGLLVAFFSASTAISGEIEKKTALTVLSKPVSRLEFILGKYLGIMGTVVVCIAVIGIALWATVASKYWIDYYQSKRSLEIEVDYQDPEILQKNLRILSTEEAKANVAVKTAATDTFKGTFLGLLQVAALAGISVAVSTRLPMVVNIVLCMGIYVFGHLSAALLCTILPNLGNLNLYWRIAEGTPVSPGYLLRSVGYVAIYVVVALYIAVFSLSRRELS